MLYAVRVDFSGPVLGSMVLNHVDMLFHMMYLLGEKKKENTSKN